MTPSPCVLNHLSRKRDLTSKSYHVNQWWDENGELLLWGSERAERLAAQLRAAGIEPESWKDTIQGEAIALRTDEQKNRDDFLIPIDLFT
jgi:hypothetical protein